MCLLADALSNVQSLGRDCSTVPCGLPLPTVPVPLSCSRTAERQKSCKKLSSAPCSHTHAPTAAAVHIGPGLQARSTAVQAERLGSKGSSTLAAMSQLQPPRQVGYLHHTCIEAGMQGFV